jgi:hypothetical protein
MNIIAEIVGIKYKLELPVELEEIDFKDFNINSMPASCLIKNDKSYFAISKWVSPKRTRSYPFERVYNTLAVSKKFTVIPVIKDEGLEGDRDFIQWDTVSLMSLLDVYVIFAYYSKADKHNTRYNKITNQQFDNDYVINKINEISSYHSSALHWNLKEIQESFPDLIEKVKNYYSKIGRELNVKFHSESGIEKFQRQFEDGVKEFMENSRRKAKEAQHREQLTIQPKEVLSSATKATITIKNYLGGLYYLTTDEILIENKKLYLIEGKHSKNSILPSIGDIKDGLLKMILYCNLSDVKINKDKYSVIPTLKLTSNLLKGICNSKDNIHVLEKFINANQFNSKQVELINSLFSESSANNFEIIIQGND